MKNTKKHWFDTLPKIYQEIVLVELKRYKPNRNIYDLPNLACAFIWGHSYMEEDFFEAIYCEISNTNKFGI